MNPAEYMLEAIGAGVTPRVGDRDWKDIWLDSPEYQIVLKEIAGIKSEALQKPPPDQKKLSTCKFSIYVAFFLTNTEIIQMQHHSFTN